jgi:hypothetical protein
VAALPIGEELSKLIYTEALLARCNVVQSTCIAIAKRNRETSGIQAAGSTIHSTNQPLKLESSANEARRVSLGSKPHREKA